MSRRLPEKIDALKAVTLCDKTYGFPGMQADTLTIELDFGKVTEEERDAQVRHFSSLLFYIPCLSTTVKRVAAPSLTRTLPFNM